jgi:HSP20 family molecular chaperone IbpA
LLLEERRTGQWERDFSFAVQVEREDVKARLEAGVLRIWVRKGEADGERGAVAGWGERGGGVTWVD